MINDPESEEYMRPEHFQPGPGGWVRYEGIEDEPQPNHLVRAALLLFVIISTICGWTAIIWAFLRMFR